MPQAPIDHEDDDPVVPPGQRLVNELLEMYASGVFCQRLVSAPLCHWAMMAGVEEADRYALSTKTSGRVQWKLDQALGFGRLDQRMYNVPTPMLSHVDDEKEQALVAIIPSHECLLREVADQPDAASSWSVQMTEDQWIGAYNDHPVVKTASVEERRTIVPLALHMDATAFAKRDSLVVFTVHFLATGRRHLAFAVRKSQLCDCECGAGTRCTRCTLASNGRWPPCPKAQCPRQATTKHRGVLKTSNGRRCKAN